MVPVTLNENLETPIAATDSAANIPTEPTTKAQSCVDEMGPNVVNHPSQTANGVDTCPPLQSPIENESDAHHTSEGKKKKRGSIFTFLFR
jgi:hypothetical protein